MSRGSDPDKDAFADRPPNEPRSGARDLPDGPLLISEAPRSGSGELAARLRALFADPQRLARLAPAPDDDRDPREDHPAPRRAAVLVPVVLGAAPSVLLTLRAATLSAHAGQVAFPGGRIEPGETPEAAAVREAAEEVGLDPRIPEILGRLPAHHTGTGFHVVPVLALIAEPPVLTPDPAEVAEAFSYPLANLLDPALPERRAHHWRGRNRDIWVWPHERHLVWGATAAMLRSLAILLRGA